MQISNGTLILRNCICTVTLSVLRKAWSSSQIQHLGEVFQRRTEGDMSNPLPSSLRDIKRNRDEAIASTSRPVYIPRRIRETSENGKANEPTSGKRLALASSTGEERAAIFPAKRARTAFQADLTNQNSTAEDPGTNPWEMNDVRGAYSGDGSAKYVLSSRGRVSRLDRGRFRFHWEATDDTTAQDDRFFHQLRKDSDKKLQSSSKASLSFGTHRKRLDRFDSRHWSEKPLQEMTDRDWRIFREDLRISVRSGGASSPHPARSWRETELPEEILDLVRNVARYGRPTPIQMVSIPVGLAGRDCIGLAETGSGKTAAFVLPMLSHILKLPQMTPVIGTGGPYALIMAPTRELALQIDTEARQFAHPLGYRVVHVIGGQGMDLQTTGLQEGCEVVVCTPGRMVDLLSRQMVVLSNCKFLILDEADRMIDMGFEPQVTSILDAMPEQSDSRGRKMRQTFMFSATMSPAIEKLARTYLRDPVVVSVGETGKAAVNVTQKVEYFTSEARRRERFIGLLDTLRPPVLVFVNTRSGCETILKFVESNSSVRPGVMHSGKSQEQRERILDYFRTGKTGVLIATDVVGRGIDIKGVKHVINFELPKTIEAYTHRIGRTGRAGEVGTAWSLATEADTDIFGSLVELLKKSGAHIPQELGGDGRGKRAKGFRPILD